MKLGIKFRDRYCNLTDKEIVDKIIDWERHDEEAATYLLWDRYDRLLRSHFYKLIHLDPHEWYDYCVESLFLALRGDNGQWEKLSNFNWKSKFCYWFKIVTYNFFNDLRDQLIERGVIIVSTDDEDPNGRKHDIADDDSHERNRRKVELIDAIRQLEDIDQKFVVMKRLEGYNSKEIAQLLQKMWDENGIIRVDKGKVVKASEGYVNVRMQRAKSELRRIIVTID